ncbi:MAG: nucleotidyl transferase AbiEii/AbiGii toxin family protein [Lachnospiraceae bacterium]|nr:nucleotidyl transferase AbiEii/AbiGii toxin family protein [Lachnospiraceae bacterium]
MRKNSKNLSGGIDLMNVASTKARLKNVADRTGKNYQELLTAYGLERTIYRLSISEYKNRFILKGGIFLYAISGGDYARATTDIDFLAQNISNDLDDIKKVFANIFLIKADDALWYDIESIQVTPITEFKEYHGINVSATAYLDKTRIHISIDIGFNDVIYPDKVEMEFPVLLGQEFPRIYAYSLDSTIAEKFEAIVSLGYENSRYKDIYDLYVFSRSYNFEGAILLEAIKETFIHRKTSMEDIVIFETGFADDNLRQSRWKNFAKNKRISLTISLQEAISALELFLSPLVKAYNENIPFAFIWNPKSNKWE